MIRVRRFSRSSPAWSTIGIVARIRIHELDRADLLRILTPRGLDEIRAMACRHGVVAAPNVSAEVSTAGGGRGVDILCDRR